VSVLSYGAWITFGTQIDEDEAYAIMRAAFARGVNLFDNAEAYADGAAETMMGAAIRRGVADGAWAREDLVVTTKLFWGPHARAGNAIPNNRVGLSRKHILEGARGSLERLGLDYVDVVYAHRPDPNVPMEEIVRAFHHLIEGKAQALYWCTSEWSAEQLRAAHAVARRLGLVAPVCEQPQYSALVRARVEREFASLYRDFGLGLTVYSPLAGGVLTGKYAGWTPATSRDVERGTRLEVRPDLRGRLETASGMSFPQIISAAGRLAEVGRRTGCSPAQSALAWTLLNPRVSSAILGGTSVAQVQENLGALDCLAAVEAAGAAAWRTAAEAALGTAPPAPPGQGGRQARYYDGWAAIGRAEA
jgi:voltage-dependent potassium channel beta subunit